MKRILFILIFCSFTFRASFAAEKCDNNFVLENPEQAIFSYIYIAGHEPWIFNQLMKSKSDEYDSFKRHQIFNELIKTNTLNHGSLKIIHNRVNNNFGGKIDILFAFNRNIFLLQGNEPGQFAIPPIDANWKTPQPDGSVFIISNSPKFINKIILIISSVSPVTLEVLSIDDCANIKRIFNSSDFNLMNYKKAPQVTNLNYDPMRSYPLGRVVINKNYSISLREFKTNYSYVLDDLIAAYSIDKNRLKSDTQ